VEERDYQTALGILIPFEQTMARSTTYYDLIGFAYSKVGEPNLAVESLEKALQLDHRNENYYLDLGQVLDEYADFGAAIQLFRWGVSAHPKSARLYVGLALAYISATRVNEARDAAEKGIALEPNLQPAYTTLAMVYKAEKDWQSLLRDAIRLEKLNPQNPWAWYYEALAQMEMQPQQQIQSPQIVKALRRAIQLKPMFPPAYFQLGKLFFQEKEYRRSIVELSHAIKLDPGQLEAHYLLAMALRRVGDVEHSKEQFEIHRRLIAEIESHQKPHIDVKIEKPD
jgi:tetratricopeptide (TPR) repeat protein